MTKKKLQKKIHITRDKLVSTLPNLDLTKLQDCCLVCVEFDTEDNLPIFNCDTFIAKIAKKYAVKVGRKFVYIDDTIQNNIVFNTHSKCEFFKRHYRYKKGYVACSRCREKEATRTVTFTKHAKELGKMMKEVHICKSDYCLRNTIRDTSDSLKNYITITIEPIKKAVKK